ncbi:MAG TPA: carboxypeptidase-like regulatory domain-containing protein, partial [Draconibacterium sp.]|nr:carboxypeptidase-like regulatory domain-containing protein [Draconibacterium sp.]
MVRLTLFVFFLGLIQVMAVDSYSQMAKLSLNVNNRSLENVLEQIEDQSEFFFLYNKDLVDVEQKVNINVQNETVKLVLDNLLEGKDISYAVYDRQIVLTNRDVVSMMTGQQKSVSGKVTDSKNQSLPGASVVIKGTTQGTVTNADGNYSLSNIPENATLVFSFVGMRSQDVVIGDQTSINVVLEDETIGLDEVVAIGYGTQRKADLTGAVSTVAPENLKQGINQSVSHALQGRVAGVTAIQNSGEPGGGVEIRIRGAGSINDNSPLYVVDGIIGSIANLNPADIESMTVLKDAASAAIYGSRGANGVVIVTTKKGKKGQKTSVSFNTSQGVQQAWKMPTSLTAEERNIIHKEALTNDNTPLSESIWNYYNNPTNAVTRTDWFEEILKPAYISTSDLSF